ncbi:MAG: hypothetical protein E6X72_00505 [Clostridioides difficile]|nr:hypothetical protein [Clostridioides difficile]
MLEFTSPVPMEKLKEKIEEGWFDEEVLIHFVNALKGPDKEKLLNGEIKPYDLFELDIMIRDRGWMQVYINSQEYADMDSETLNVVKERIDRLFEQAKEECRVDIDGTEEVAPEEQYPININKRRKEHGLESIENGNIDFIPIYLQHFKMNINPKESLLEQDIKPELKELGIDIITKLKEKELTYVDAYVTLEYVYRNLKFMSEYTHL